MPLAPRRPPCPPSVRCYFLRGISPPSHSSHGEPSLRTKEALVPLRECARKLQDLKAALGSARRVLILTHDNPDPDCLASAQAFKLIFTHMDRECAVASGGEVGRAENRALLDVLELEILPLHEVELAPYDFFLFVDSQPGSGNNSCRLPQDARYGIVDHHILGENWPHEPAFLDLREHYGASATMAYEYLLARNLRVDVPLATALYYAIRTETSDMGRGAGRSDRAAYLKLHPKIDWEILHRIVNSRLPVDYFLLLREAVERAQRFGRAVVVDLGPIRHPDFVAELADTFRRLEGIHWALVWGWQEGRVVFSLRSNTQDPHMGHLARELVQGRGSAGGHRQMAGGQLRAQGTDEEELRLQFRRAIVPAFLRAVEQPVQDGLSLSQDGGLA